MENIPYAIIGRVFRRNILIICHEIQNVNYKSWSIKMLGLTNKLG